MSSTHVPAYQVINAFTKANPSFKIYPNSVAEKGALTCAIAKHGLEKTLIAVADDAGEFPDQLSGSDAAFNGSLVKLCPLNAGNAAVIRTLFPYTAPVLVGNKNSFGFGDRLGNAGAAHLRSLENADFIPILAQQSIREMNRTKRSPQEVMDAATWAVFQEGYTKGFGSDADHLKTTKDIDRTVEAGFTMFTIDPGDYVDNRVVDMDEAQLEAAYKEIPWLNLYDTPEDFWSRYLNKTFDLGNGVSLSPSKTDLLRAAVKYGKVIVHTHELFTYLKDVYPDRDSEVELSVDETPFPTTPAEHLVIASELKRLGVELVSLAPRFCGEFEKGIDFKGDLNAFKKEYIMHQSIASRFGNYKLSIHSGSDKFAIYAAIGELKQGTVHVKTAGTSYLEALRAISMTHTSLFREILGFSTERFETDRKTYHISASLDKLGDPAGIADDDLPLLLDDDTARQIFHVTFGSVLTAEMNGERLFYRRFMETLSEHEAVYETCLTNHFRKHLKPFE